jgi:RecA/RadA recombinase
MAKQKKEENQDLSTRSDKDILSSYLNQNKNDHFNFIEEKYFKISSGSLILDSVLDGGFSPGLHRFVGFTSGGKTSEAMQVLKNFLKTVVGSKGIYFSAEGRLNNDVKKRSGLKFVTDPNQWDEGTVFVYESNIYESVAGFIEMLITSDNGIQYGIVLDSVDGLSLKADASKNYDESAKVAGGPVVASVLMKRISIPLAKKGHLAIFISQVRSEVVLDPYSPKPVRQITSTGGNALLHYANIILQFEPRYKGDMIMNNEKEAPSPSNPLLGHWAKVIIKKSSNDKNNYVVRYPIKYDSSGGSSVWKEKEVVDCMLQWGDLEKKGAWYNFSEELVSSGLVKEQKFQGIDSIYSYFSENKDLVNSLYKYLSKNISKAYNDNKIEE